MFDNDAIIPGVLYVFDASVAGYVRPATEDEAATITAALTMGR